MTGEVGILNVGAGDIKVSFDKNNPVERVRAARIVKDMLRRGYALLIEVEQPDGTSAYQRALDFREDTCEYIIADYDPLHVVLPTQDEIEHEKLGDAPTAASGPATGPETEAAPRTRKGRQRKAVDAGSVRSVAVSRSSGG